MKAEVVQQQKEWEEERLERKLQQLQAEEGEECKMMIFDPHDERKMGKLDHKEQRIQAEKMKKREEI